MEGMIKNLRLSTRFRDGTYPRKVVATVLKNGKPCGVSFAARITSSTRRDPVELSTNATVHVNEGDELSVRIDFTPPAKDLSELQNMLGYCAFTFEDDTEQ